MSGGGRIAPFIAAAATIAAAIISGLFLLASNGKFDSEPSADDLTKQLQEELNNKQWSKANKSTDDILYKLMGVKNQEEVIDGEKKVSKDKIFNISCESLNQIDDLWISSSEKKFGFSIQLEIWEETKNNKGNHWDNFADKVGWRENDKWSVGHYDFSSYSQVNKGYLPTFILVRDGNISWDTFFRHLKECEM